MDALVANISGWFDDLQAYLPTIDTRYLVIAAVLQTAQTLLGGLAWRNVLDACYPLDKLARREIVAAYCGGVGLNAFLPVQAGTIATLGISRALIAKSRTPTIIAAAAVQNLLYLAIGLLVWAYLLIAQPGATDVTYDLLAENVVVAVLTAALVVGMVFVVIRLAWDWLGRLYDKFSDGAAILRTPVRYVTGVLLPQLASYGCRLGVTITFLAATGIPVSLRTVLLVAAANSISTSIAVTPGGIGTQQALTVVALSGVASASAVTAYSITQQAMVTAWNIAFGLGAMAVVFGWAATGTMLRHRHGGDRPPPPPALAE